MTLDQIVAQVAGRLNLTSDTALARIADDVRETYRRVLGAINMPTSSRGVVTAGTVVDYRYVTFNGVQKLLSVFTTDGTTTRMLNQVTFDELRNRQVMSDPCRSYAIATMGSNEVTIFLDCTPASVYTLSADALVDAASLTGSDSPAFPEIYHDLLVYGAKAIELDKMEKPGLSAEAKNEYEARLAELRYFIAKSAYLVQYQGRTGNWGLGASWYWQV